MIAIALWAAAASAQPAPPAITITGYVEAFYQHNFNDPTNLVTAYRGFDDRSDSFTIDNAVLDVTAVSGDVSTRIALQVGHTPAAYYASEPSYPAASGAGATGPELWRLIQQAIVGYKLGKLQTEAGIFLSPIGIENLPIKDQWNWSRSNLFFALPYYHAGVRATYPLTDTLTGVVYATNGWNDIVNRNPYPCFAGVLQYAPSPEISAQLLYFGGVEAFAGAPEGQPWRHLFDAAVTWNVTRDVAIATQADAGFEPNNLGTSRWVAGALYARVRPTKRLYAVVRGDWFHERDAPGPPRLFFPADDVGSVTLTADYRPANQISLRVEYRDDRASAPMYFRGPPGQDPTTGLPAPTATSQQTLTFGAVTWF